jgi:hypothetical protein
MSRFDSKWMRPRVLVPVSLVLLASLIALAGGCGGKDNTVTLRYAPDVVAVTAGDSVATGVGLEVKIHWRSTATCQSFEGVAFQPIDDTTFVALAVVRETRDPKVPCSARDTVLEGGFVLKDPPAKAFRLIVYGAKQQDTLFVQGGVAASAIERHVIQIENAVDGSPVGGATADLVDLTTSAVIASLTMDSAGNADTAFACAGGPRAYEIRAVGASGRRATLVFVARPQHCGIPERTWIRI